MRVRQPEVAAAGCQHQAEGQQRSDNSGKSGVVLVSHDSILLMPGYSRIDGPDIAMAFSLVVPDTVPKPRPTVSNAELGRHRAGAVDFFAVNPLSRQPGLRRAFTLGNRRSGGAMTNCAPSPVARVGRVPRPSSGIAVGSASVRRAKNTENARDGGLCAPHQPLQHAGRPRAILELLKLPLICLV